MGLLTQHTQKHLLIALTNSAALVRGCGNPADSQPVLDSAKEQRNQDKQPCMVSPAGRKSDVLQKYILFFLLLLQFLLDFHVPWLAHSDFQTV